jgi:hypothetical protein
MISSRHHWPGIPATLPTRRRAMALNGKVAVCEKTQSSLRRRSVFCDVVLQLFPDVFDGTAEFPAWKEISRQVGLQDLYCLQERAGPKPVRLP